MDSSFLPKDEIWFLRVCHHISTGLYYGHTVSVTKVMYCSPYLTQPVYCTGWSPAPCAIVLLSRVWISASPGRMEKSVFWFGVGCRLLSRVPSLQVIHSLWAVCSIDRESLVGSLMTGEKWTCYLVRGKWRLVPTVITAWCKCREILTDGFLQSNERSPQNAVSHKEAELWNATVGLRF